jgi:hypothetical protein
MSQLFSGARPNPPKRLADSRVFPMPSASVVCIKLKFDSEVRIARSLTDLQPGELSQTAEAI